MGHVDLALGRAALAAFLFAEQMARAVALAPPGMFLWQLTNVSAIAETAGLGRRPLHPRGSVPAQPGYALSMFKVHKTHPAAMLAAAVACSC